MLYTYLVFHTKYNRKILDEKIRKRAEEIVSEILNDLGCEILKIKIHPNYVHVYIGYPPTLAMAKIANRVKGKSSCLLRKDFPELKSECPKALWAPKYGLYS